MTIQKLDDFAENGDKNLTGIDVQQGFVQAEKPARQWFNYIFNSITNKVNEVVVDVNANSQSVIDNANGVGQTWENMVASRSKDTIYANTTGRPILVNVSFTATGDSTARHLFSVNGILVGKSESRYVSGTKYSFTSAIVPSSATYTVTSTDGLLNVWSELR